MKQAISIFPLSMLLLAATAPATAAEIPQIIYRSCQPSDMKVDTSWNAESYVNRAKRAAGLRNPEYPEIQYCEVVMVVYQGKKVECVAPNHGAVRYARVTGEFLRHRFPAVQGDAERSKALYEGLHNFMSRGCTINRSTYDFNQIPSKLDEYEEPRGIGRYSWRYRK